MSVVSTISITTTIVIMIGIMVITDMICAVVTDVHQCCIYNRFIQVLLYIHLFLVRMCVYIHM